MSVILNVPPTIGKIVQEGLVERAMHDSLFPNLMYREEALWEEWEPNTGVELFIQRRGNLAPNTTPLPANTDPTPQTRVFEQWPARLDHFGDAMDVHVPTSASASIDLFLNDVKTLGM